jgi:aspartate aminotransferase
MGARYAFSPRIAALPRSGIREIYDVANRTPGCIHLEVGEPNFATPPHIVEAAARAGRDGFTKYTASRGIPALVDLIVDKLARQNGLNVSGSDVLVTTGGVTAIFEAIAALVDPGDTVLLPDPGWPNTEAMVQLLSGRVVRYRLVPSEGFAPDLVGVRQLARSLSPRLIYINSPSNPTGAVLSANTIKSLCEIADEVGAFVVSDECYEAITFDRRHTSAASFLPGRVFTAFSFSKTYAMTGWRIGYLVTPPGLGEDMTKLQEPIISCATAVAQKAAEAALGESQQCVADMVAAYRARRDRVVDVLADTGLLLSVPQGAFYALVDVSAAGEPSAAFARRLVNEAGVAVAPGSTFGPSMDRAVRLSLASELEAVDVGTRRLVAALHEKAV